MGPALEARHATINKRWACKEFAAVARGAVKRWVLLAVLVSMGPGAASARAETYPWVPEEDHVRLVADPVVDLGARLYLIRQARTSIDLALYEQGDDAVGLPVLHALREAADRGVHVRIITQWFFQYIYHPLNRSPSYVTNPPTAVPIEYVVFGSPMSIMQHGWHPSDGIHGKVLVVDGAWALVTGRGHAEMNLRWADSSHLLKGALVDQVSQAFQRLWTHAVATGEVIRPTVQRTEADEDQDASEVPVQRLDPARRATLRGLVDWLHKPAWRAPGAEAPRGRARLLHTDFVEQMVELRKKGSNPSAWEDRMSLVKDPMLDSFVERMERVEPGTEVRFTSMYAVLHPRLKEAVCTARKRGATVTLFTNGDFVTPPVSTLAWFASVNDLHEVARCGTRVVTFKRHPGRPWNFNHLKLVLVGDTLYFGSHNLNVASSVANDEFMVEVEDAAVAAESRAYFDLLARENGRLAYEKDMGAQRPLGIVGRQLLEPILGFW